MHWLNFVSILKYADTKLPHGGLWIFHIVVTGSILTPSALLAFKVVWASACQVQTVCIVRQSIHCVQSASACIESFFFQVSIDRKGWSRWRYCIIGILGNDSAQKYKHDNFGVYHLKINILSDWLISWNLHLLNQS